MDNGNVLTYGGTTIHFIKSSRKIAELTIFLICTAKTCKKYKNEEKLFFRFNDCCGVKDRE
jgi:hypothetical protein